MTAADDSLVSKAREALEKSYAPYSLLKVGAAVKADSGKIYTGCNVENASYGLTVCAERIAIFSAIANGERKLEAIAIVSDDIPEPLPCGACLQVMNEFGIQRVLVGRNSGYETFTLDELLPKPFKLR